MRKIIEIIAIAAIWFSVGYRFQAKKNSTTLYLYCYNGSTWDRCREHGGFQTTIGPAQRVMATKDHWNSLCVDAGNEQMGWLIYRKEMEK